MVAFSDVLTWEFLDPSRMQIKDGYTVHFSFSISRRRRSHGCASKKFEIRKVLSGSIGPHIVIEYYLFVL